MATESPAGAPAPAYDVELLDVVKRFDAAAAVDHLTLRVAHGTFFSLLGPSGCGKTTTLRLIAGFEQPTSGQVLIGGADVAGLPPNRRDVNTVFQHYALFPHMSVADNVAYGLRQSGTSRPEIQRRVAEALRMVRLSGAEKRRPAELSGGQQQRVALARALVNRPTVLLLDEPLSALDLKLRKEMQAELKALQKTVGITFIYVTHDQDEAITLSDRMAVMNAGHLEQEGAPADVYDRPRTRFVADFIGLTNFLGGSVRAVDPGGADGRHVVVRTDLGDLHCGGWQPELTVGERVTLTLRPEKVRLFPSGAAPGAGWNAVAGVVINATFLGPQNEYRVRVGANTGTDHRELLVRQQNISTLAAGAALDGPDGGVADAWRAFAPGEPVMLAWRYEATLILREPAASARHEEAAEGPAPASQTAMTSSAP